MVEDFLGIPETILNGKKWKDIESQENKIGPDKLLEAILEKKLWSNEEITWVIRRLIFYYGKNDELLKSVPHERIFANFTAVLRVVFLLLDKNNPDIDDNMRSYISSKLSEATFGISGHTRNYLYKLKK